MPEADQKLVYKLKRPCGYYHEELIKQLFTRKYLWATHVWNMFDFGADARNEGGENGQNHKSLMTFDRKYKKDSFYAYKA